MSITQKKLGDVTFEIHGFSLMLARLNTPAARDWVAEHVMEPTYFGNALALEHRYADTLAERMLSDGLVVNFGGIRS